MFLDKVAAVVIIENSDRQLLLLRRNHLPLGFCLPGGKIDLMKESLKEGATREVFEETGIRISTDDLQYRGVKQSINGLQVHIFEYGKLSTALVKLSDEHSAYIWTNSLEDLNLAGNTKDFLSVFTLDDTRLSITDELQFGKHKGRTLKQIMEYDTQYIIWLHENTQFKVQNKVLKEAKSIIKREKDDESSRDWEENNQRYEEKRRQDNLKNAVSTPFGMAIDSGQGNHQLLDDQGNDNGEIIHWYYGWNKGSWGDGL